MLAVSGSGAASLLLLLILLASSNFVAPAQAGDELSIQMAKSLVLQASVKQKSAESLAELSEIVSLCGKALAGPLPDDRAAYARQLLGWAHNRRGELLVEGATAAAERDDDEAAMRLDRQAMTEFDQAIASDPRLAKAWYNRGAAHGVHGDVEKAIADLSRAVELDPTHANSWFNRGELRLAEGDFDGAVGDYTRTLELSPRDVGAWFGRGRAQAGRRKFAEALIDFDKAIELDNRSAAAFIVRGDALTDLGRWSEALDDYRTAVRLDSRRPRALAGIAWILATSPQDRLRDPAEALRTAQRAVALDGERDWRSLDALGAALAANARYDDARAATTKALALAPTDIAERLRVRLALYEKQQPYRESPRR